MVTKLSTTPLIPNKMGDGDTFIKAMKDVQHKVASTINQLIEEGVGSQAATVSVGSTTTLPAGSNASVTNSGTSSAAVLNFSIPQGAAGTAGAQGPIGPSGVADIRSGVVTVSMDQYDSGSGMYYSQWSSNNVSFSPSFPSVPKVSATAYIANGGGSGGTEGVWVSNISTGGMMIVASSKYNTTADIYWTAMVASTGTGEGGSVVLAPLNLPAWIEGSTERGGTLLLENCANSTINTGIRIDQDTNKIRIMENGGDYRGYFLDITKGAVGAGTEIGGSGVVVGETYANVKSYGNTQSDWQRCLNENNCCVFPPGVYNLSSPLITKGNHKHLVGCGSASRLHATGNNATLMVDATQQTYYFGSIKNMAFSVQTGITRTANAGIVFTNDISPADYIIGGSQFTDLWFFDCYYGCLMSLDGVEISGHPEWGLHSSFGWNIFDRLTFVNGNYGLYFPTGSGTGNVYSNIVGTTTDCLIKYAGTGYTVGDIVINGIQGTGGGGGIEFSSGCAYRARIAINGWQFDAGASFGIKIPTNYTEVSIGAGSKGGAAPNYLPAHMGLSSRPSSW